jgi:hypothetical protein
MMKMSTMNVSLTPEQSEYVRRTFEREYGNASEYFRERMACEIEADLGLLYSTTKGAPAGPNEQEIEAILKTQRAVRKKLQRESRF